MAIEYVALATSPSGDGRTQADLPVYKEPLFSRSRRWPVPAFLYRVKYIYFIPLILLPIACHVVFNLATPYFSSNPVSQGTGDNPYFSTGDVLEHNIAVATRLENCANLGILRNTSLPLDTLSESEEAELIEQGCGTNQTTVVILSSLWFAEAFAGTSTAGEAIYAQSVISTLNAYNYSYVFSSLGWYNNDMRKTVELWRQHKWNVRMVLSDPEQIDVCYKDEGQECLKTKTNPEGIESWRLLSFWYWDDVKNPLGAQFTLSPSPRNDNYFLSYSIEPTCRRLPFVPPPQRPHPPQAYLLAKQVKYFSDESGKFAWTLKFLSHIKTSLGISLVAGMNNDDEDLALKVKEAGIENFGRLSKIDFYQKLSQSFVFIGVGQPRISPSPWDALCMGVPFINPILQWDENDPSNRTSWHAQQWHMTDVEPPYVYHVHAHDLDQLRKTIQHARATPIGSYIPEYMRFEFVRDRAVELLQRDWRAVAEGIMRERVKSGGEVYEL